MLPLSLLTNTTAPLECRTNPDTHTTMQHAHTNIAQRLVRAAPRVLLTSSLNHLPFSHTKQHPVMGRNSYAHHCE